MPHFTRQFSNGAPLLIAVLNVTKGRADALAEANLPIPTRQRLSNALVDTGASCTCVNPEFINALGLSPTGKTLMFTPSTGAQGFETDQYDARLTIWAGDNDAPLEIPIIPIVASELKVQGIDALIGRDVLEHCILMYNGDTEFFSLAF